MTADEIIALMQEHGVRPTAGRICVARTLAGAGRPMSLGELETELGSIDKSVISRALSTFRAAHMMHVLQDGSDAVRYELCLSHSEDEDSDAHVHFHCTVCGRTFCLHGTPIPPVTLSAGWSASRTTYVIEGTCPDCSR